MTTQWYRMHDPDPNGVFPIDPSEARHWNARNEGIFAALNEFDGPRRIANLRRIRAWAVDMDSGSKEEQAERIKQSPLVPTRIVETKNGFHVHWAAKDGTPDMWNPIVLERLVYFFGSDKNARDMARILRVPSFYHLKDPNDPFLVRRVHRWGVSYTERQMLAAFPRDPEADKAEEDAKKLRSEVRFSGDTNSDNFWERAIALDCRYALERLSGHWLVGGEHFSFKRNASGTQNILVGKKSTSCWIDTAGRIGSNDKGGPSITRWCRWYGHSWRDIARGLREVLPELEGR